MSAKEPYKKEYFDLRIKSFKIYSILTLLVAIVAILTAIKSFYDDKVTFQKIATLNEENKIWESSNTSNLNTYESYKKLIALKIDTSSFYSVGANFEFAKSNLRGDMSDFSAPIYSNIVTGGDLEKWRIYYDTSKNKINEAFTLVVDTTKNREILYKNTKTYIAKIKTKKLASSEVYGDFNFSISDTMKVNESYRALLLVSKNIENEVIEQIVGKSFQQDKPSMVQDTTILSNTMYASLKDANNNKFKILLSNLDSIQTFRFDRAYYALWEWIVTPIEEGDNTLVLNLSHVKKRSNNLSTFVPSKLITVHVKAIDKSKGRRFIEFLKEYWWLIGGIALLIAWLINLFFPRSK